MKKKPVLLLLTLILLLAGCVTGQQSGPQTGPAVTTEPATPTPEVFIPLDPSPTPLDNTLPLTCQVTDLSVFIGQDAGYCFAYPPQFRMDDGSSEVLVVGPGLDESNDPLRASLGIEVHPVPEGSSLANLVNGYLSQPGFQNLPWTIQQAELSLGGESAIRVEPIPGLGNSRQVFTLHRNRLYSLRFHPVDLEVGQAEVEALYQTVTGSFAFLDGTQPAQSQPGPRVVEWTEFGQKISLEYNPLLAPWVEGLTVPAIPLDAEGLSAGSHPTVAQIRFLGFMGGRPYQLPYMTVENQVAQVSVFQTADFAGYGDLVPSGFPNQLRLLTEILENGLEPGRCAEALYANEQALPFLPWVNYKQVFCAQPQILEFTSGRGLRYLTFYSQAPGTAPEGRIFYTFQGLTTDGKYYLSATFPVLTGIFPSELSAGQIETGQAYRDTMNEGVDRLNSMEVSDFDPALSMLDDLVRSIKIEIP